MDAVGGAVHHIGNVHKYAWKEDYHKFCVIEFDIEHMTGKESMGLVKQKNEKFERSTIMNTGQKMFHDFFMNMVKEGHEDEAEKVLAESFERQENGTFNVEYMQSIVPKYFSLIKPECTEQLKNAMEHFSSNL